MRWPAPFVLALLLTAAPASALLVPSYPIEGEIPLTTLGGARRDPQLTILSGRADIEGAADGLFTFGQTTGARVANVTRLEVYDTTGALGSINLREFQRTGRPIHQAYADATLTLPSNATFYYHTDDSAQSVRGRLPFGFAVPVLPPRTMESNRAINLTAGPSLALVGDGEAHIAFAATGEDAFVYVPDPDTQVTVRAGITTHTYDGRRYLFRLLSSADVHVPALGSILVPLEGNTTVSMGPAATAALEAGFNIARLNASMRFLLPNASGQGLPVHPRMQQALGAVAPIFNGALIGNPRGRFSVGGEEATVGNLTVVRFGELSVRLDSDAADRVAVQGQGPFVLLGGRLHSDKAAVGPAFLPLPLLSVVLWIVAAGAIALRILLKPFLPASPANSSPPIRLFALIARWLLAVIAFLLWDAEVRAFLGTSFLTILLVGPRDPLGFGVVAIFQFLPYGLALLFFGLPVRFIANALLRLANMKAARGLGKGLGYVSAWGLGAPFLPLLMAPFIGLLSENIGKALG